MVWKFLWFKRCLLGLGKLKEVQTVQVNWNCKDSCNIKTRVFHNSCFHIEVPTNYNTIANFLRISTEPSFPKFRPSMYICYICKNWTNFTFVSKIIHQRIYYQPANIYSRKSFGLYGLNGMYLP